MYGGCGTIGGWGARFAKKGASKCTTDFSSKSPHKIAECLSHWTVKGHNVTSCTKEEMGEDDMRKPCKRFIRELRFHKHHDREAKREANNSKYSMLDLHDIVKRTRAAVKIEFKAKSKFYKFYCGSTRLSTDEKEKSNGWCATDLNKKGAIKKWGFCSPICQDKRQTFMSANLNILTDKECNVLIDAMPKGRRKVMNWNEKYEFCAGKKHSFPKKMYTFKRLKKKQETINEERASAKKLGLSPKVRPTRYWYKLLERRKVPPLGTPDDYPYDWFLGGVDSCQGDSGGPLWRNIQDGNLTRATQIGVVTRGLGCAGFNRPAMYGSVKKVFTWIKETVEKNMKEKKFCPAKNSRI